jgi:hypothetical protein
MKTAIRYSIVTLLALLGVTPAADPQDASSPKTFFLVPIPSVARHHQHASPRLRNANGSSGNWAGYAVANRLNAPSSGVVSEVKATWTVPSVSASDSARTYSSIWVGIDGYSDTTVEQTGTEQDVTPDGPVYYAWFEMYPKFGYRIGNFPVEPGDVISAEVRYVGNNRFRLSISNLTKNVTFATTQRNKAKRQSAEWIVEAPYSHGTLPLADFDTMTLTDCSATLSGQTGSITDPSWQFDAITMADPSGAVKAEPFGLSADGASFSVTWGHE